MNNKVSRQTIKEKMLFRRTLAVLLMAVMIFAVPGNVPVKVKAAGIDDFLPAIDTESNVLSVVNSADDEYVTSKQWITPAAIHDEDVSEDIIVRRGAELPERYDAREHGLVTAVKDQGTMETCWAFASASVIETNLIKNGLAGPDINISENAIAYFFYNRQVDKLGLTTGDYNRVSRAGRNYLTAAGTLYGAGLDLITGSGVNSEAQSPYLTTPSADLAYNGEFMVKNFYVYNYNTLMLDKTVSNIKQAILDHGSVACGIYMAAAYLDKTNGSYYCPIKNGNHAITIVGWDDSYSKENFKVNPGVDGAWIVKNSYGPNQFDRGYNYVSYADKSLTEFVSFEMTRRDAFYQNNYQYDGTACPAYISNKASYYANVFKANGAGGNNEELKAVGIFTSSVAANYDIQIYTGLTKNSKPTSGTKAFAASVKGSLKDAGYNVIELPTPVSLTAGEHFSVVVRITTQSGANAYMGLDHSYYNPSNDWVRFIAETGNNQSFAKINGKWYDVGKSSKANNRIKAYTDAVPYKSDFHLDTKQLGVSKGDTKKLTLLAAPNVFRKVTWKSADSSIAKVNLKGGVKGKKYGTTTVSATFMAGAKKKTLKCKVTVGPSRMKGFKVGYDGNVRVSWKKNSQATGYQVVYSTSPDGGFTKLAQIKKNKKTSLSVSLGPGVYYIKMRPFKKQGSKKLYGSYTAPLEVVVQ